VSAPADRLHGAFARALCDADQSPVDRAITLLTFGIQLRRHRDERSARDALATARETFQALGMVPLAQFAAQQLRASGETNRTVAFPSQLLTTHELKVARMAALGMTNREIGQRLHLSPRTIGAQLYRIFPKLGVSSRSELPSLLEAERAAA
jgi:DNA-binding NarL/FixJ family response regulator